MAAADLIDQKILKQDRQDQQEMYLRLAAYRTIESDFGILQLLHQGLVASWSRGSPW